MSNEKTLVITGRGIVSAAGSDIGELRDRLRGERTPAATSAFRRISGVEDVPPYYAILEDGWEPPSRLRTNDFFTRIAVAAASVALQESRIDTSALRIGLVLGSAFGPADTTQAYLERLAQRGSRGLSPSFFLESMMSMPAGYMSICLGVRGAIAVVQGGHPLDVARLWLATGRECAVVVVGAETLSSALLHVLSRPQLEELRPGVYPMFGQIAAALVIERRDHAEQRGAWPLATILSMASGPTGKSREITSRALGNANISEDDIDVVCSCANGVLKFDAEATRTVQTAARSATTIVYPKRLLGETLGASGVASLFCATLIQEENQAPRRDHLVLVHDQELYGQCSAVVAAA